MSFDCPFAINGIKAVFGHVVITHGLMIKEIYIKQTTIHFLNSIISIWYINVQHHSLHYSGNRLISRSRCLCRFSIIFIVSRLYKKSSSFLGSSSFKSYTCTVHGSSQIRSKKNAKPDFVFHVFYILIPFNLQLSHSMPYILAYAAS